ncbi:hypothetical protein B566_EDAN002507 [Ephemera danica]|nr:hypothetical protein B566_EDAN002507 [Ephemera danica]
MVVKILCIALILGVTVNAVKLTSPQNNDAQSWKPSEPLRDRRTIEGSPAGYTYSYGVSDPHTGDHKSASETRNSGTVRGHYSLLESDGTIRTVHYIADPYLGFRAFVSKSGPSQHPTIQSTPGRYFEKPIVVAPLAVEKPAPVMEHQLMDIPRPPPFLDIFHKNMEFTPTEFDLYRNIFSEGGPALPGHDFPSYRPPVPLPFLQAPLPDAPYYPFARPLIHPSGHHGVPELPVEHYIDQPLFLNHAKAPIVRMKYDHYAAPVPVYLGHGHDLGGYSENLNMGYGGYKLLRENKFP